MSASIRRFLIAAAPSAIILVGTAYTIGASTYPAPAPVSCATHG